MRIVNVNVRLTDHGYVAEGFEDFGALRYSILSEGATWDGLKTDLREVVNAIYYDTPKPDRIVLHLQHEDELLFP